MQLSAGAILNPGIVDPSGGSPLDVWGRKSMVTGSISKIHHLCGERGWRAGLVALPFGCSIVFVVFHREDQVSARKLFLDTVTSTRTSLRTSLLASLLFRALCPSHLLVA